MTDILEFTFTAEQQQLREQAREVAHKGVEKHGRFNDSWINGFSKEFAPVSYTHLRAHET